MTKQAHVTSRPGYEVGDKVLGLCGKEFKVTVLWSDLPKDKPICRDCVDTALAALTEADAMIENTRIGAALIRRRVEILVQSLNPEDNWLNLIHDRDFDHRAQQEDKREEKAERKRAKHTCTCAWTSQEMFTVDPNCPIHTDPVEGATES
jgi:hypothetical protein